MQDNLPVMYYMFGGGSPTPPSPIAPPPTPAAPPPPSSQPTPDQQSNIASRITPAQGEQTQILTSPNIDLKEGVKKNILGG